MKYIIFTASEAIFVSPEKFDSYKGDKMMVNGKSFIRINNKEITLVSEFDLLKANVSSLDGKAKSFYLSTRNPEILFQNYKKIKNYLNSFVNQEILFDEIERLTYSLQKQREENSKIKDEKEQLLFELAFLAHKVEKLENQLERVREIYGIDIEY